MLIIKAGLIILSDLTLGYRKPKENYFRKEK